MAEHANTSTDNNEYENVHIYETIKQTTQPKKVGDVATCAPLPKQATFHRAWLVGFVVTLVILGAACAGVIAMYVQLTNSQRVAENLADQVVALKNSVDSSNERAEIVDQSFQELRTEMASFGKLQTQIATILGQMAYLQTEMNSLQNVSTQVESLQNLETQVMSLTTQMVSVQNLSTQVTSLATQVASLQNLETQMTSLTTQVTSLTTQMVSLRNLSTQVTSLATQVASLQNLETQLASLTTQVTSLKAEFTSLSTQVTTLKTQMTSMTAEMTSLTTQVTSLEEIQIQRGIRLVGGTRTSTGSIFSGRVEIIHNGQWGTVCDDNFGTNEAEVICGILGYDNGVSRVSAYYGEGSGTIWLDDLRCTGDEVRLEDCPHNGWGVNNCGHHEDAGVYCS